MKKFGIKGNREIPTKGEILFETDTLEGVDLQEGVIYYINTDSVLEGVTYKKGYYKYQNLKLSPFGDGDSGYGLPVKSEKITDYAWELDYDNLDYTYAKENLKGGYTSTGACTAIYKDGLLGRNLDWYFGKDIEAVVRTKRTIAVCGGIKEITDEKMIGGTADKGKLKLLPFLVRDGINSRGLACCINVVPSTGNTASEPTEKLVHKISSYCLCRFILDNFDDAEEACETIKKTVSIVFDPESEFEDHYFIADRKKCFCLEVIDNEVQYHEANVMSNFHLTGIYSLLPGGKVHTPADGGFPHQTQGVDEYGEGLERYNEMIDALPSITGQQTMFSNGLDNILYTETYKENHDWYTEFVGGSLTVDSPTSAFADVRLAEQTKYASFVDDEARREDGTLWHTTHSSVYDTLNNTLRIKFNEDTTEYKDFEVPTEYESCFTVVNGQVCQIYESED